jgi:hypothetical protein
LDSRILVIKNPRRKEPGMTAVPTGVCYCGCGESVGRSSLFKIGHDKKATSILDAILHDGSVADRILDHGYGPGQRSLRAEGLKRGIIEMCGHQGCNEALTTGSEDLRRHRRSHG